MKDTFITLNGQVIQTDDNGRIIRIDSWDIGPDEKIERVPITPPSSSSSPPSSS